MLNPGWRVATDCSATLSARSAAALTHLNPFSALGTRNMTGESLLFGIGIANTHLLQS